MDNATVSSNSKSSDLTSTDDSTESSIIVKFRRLKIEENVLAKITRTWFADTIDESFTDKKYYEDKRTLVSDKLKTYFIEIRDLFEEVKVNTISQDNLQALDIDGVKKTVLNLENKISNFKTSLQHQLQYLKSEEMDLLRQIDENPNKEKICKTSTKLEKKAFSEIVPSPVKNLIHSPFKSQEVQDFQEFMASSKNRYGGWIPYNHDIFVKSWWKYFGTQNNIENFVYQDVNVEDSELFQQFIHDVSDKIAGVKLEDLLAHNKWYTKYVYLKERQKKALEKWRVKKHLIKKSSKLETSNEERCRKPRQGSATAGDFKKSKNVVRDANRNNQKQQEATEFLNFVKNADDIVKDIGNNPVHLSKYKFTSTYANPTKQWNNRCKDGDEECKERAVVGYIEKYIPKRHIPHWRLVFKTT